LDKSRGGLLYDGPRAVMRKARHKESGTQRAVKFSGRSEASAEQWEAEVELIKQLDHPHICRLIETFEDNEHFAAVMELPGGRDLLSVCDSGKARLPENVAGVLSRQMLSALGHLHELKVCHAELSPECFFFTKPLPRGMHLSELCLKLLDTGRLVELGTPDESGGREVKPQTTEAALLAARKGCKAPEQVGCAGCPLPSALCSGDYDVWAVGAIAFFTLAGHWPVLSREKTVPLQPEKVWQKSSSDCRAFIAACLAYRPEERPAVPNLLESPWIVKAKKAYEAALKTQHQKGNAQLIGADDIVGGFNAITEKSEFEKAAITALAHQLPESSVSRLRLMFEELDSSGDGKLTVEEIRTGLKKLGHLEGSAEIMELLEAADTDGSGMIEYTEFIACTVDRRKAANADATKAAFKVFDADGDGAITVDEVREALGEEAAAALADADGDGDGKVSVAEFQKLLQK